jgi:oligopeptide/dipeptide ABC transporter ATP-binding protein
VTAPVLEVTGLVTSFPAEKGRCRVVGGVDLRIGMGEVLALVGESGCGKSITALSIMRLVPKPGRIEDGRILVAGTDVRGLSVPEMRQVRGRDVAMIFQEPTTSLNPVTRVGLQVTEAILLHERVTRAEARKRTVDLLRDVGIAEPERSFDTYPHQLSGGMRQRVMIAMALSTRPKLLIADEPTTALDVTIQAQILSLLRDLVKNFGVSVLLITHNLGVVNELADRVAVMYAGQIAETGTRADVLGRAAHPYTAGLLKSMPALAKPGERLHEIPGVVPPPAEWPPGCHFCTRCPRAFEPCAATVPAETILSEGHTVFCHAVRKDLGHG